MNSSFKTFLLTGIPFGVFMGLFCCLLFYNYNNGLIIGILTGIFPGLFFGIYIVLFTKIQSKKFQSERPLLTNEKLIKEGPANHFLNKEGVGGWIYLTSERFLFKSHSINFQNHELSISLSEIKEAEKGNTFGIIPNQLRIKLENEKVEKFVVNDAADWAEKIQELG